MSPLIVCLTAALFFVFFLLSDKNLNLLFTILQEEKDKAVRANIVISLGDMCVACVDAIACVRRYDKEQWHGKYWGVRMKIYSYALNLCARRGDIGI